MSETEFILEIIGHLLALSRYLKSVNYYEIYYYKNSKFIKKLFILKPNLISMQ